MNPLEQLKDIHQATPPGWWPLAWGWWLLAALVLISLILLVIGVRQYRLRRAAKRQALVLLSQLTPDQKNLASELNQLLKRAALHYFPASQVSKLHGNQWLSFLITQLPKSKRDAFASQWQQLQQAQYQAEATLAAPEQVFAQTKVWLKQALPPSKKQLNTSFVALDGGEHV